MKTSLFLKINNSASENTDEKAVLRSMGDKARSKGDWAAAASNYAAYLSLEPSDFSIWVQLGHAYKEAGSYAEAKMAYGEAVKLNPKDFDLHLNIGHLMKLTGERQAAIEAYTNSYKLNPSIDDALHELIGLGASLSALEQESAQATKTLFLDMTDLIEYVKTNPSLSGIQRVVANLIEGIESYTRAGRGINVSVVIPEYDKMRIFSVSRSLVMKMINALHEGGDNRAALNRAIDAAYASRRLVEPKPGDIFAIAGAFWIYPHFDMVRRLRQRGVRFVVFIHDLIQISHPEFVHEAATMVFRRALVDVLTLANGVLTNSEFVANEVREFMRKRVNFELPVKAVPLSTELTPPSEAGRVLSEKVRDILREPYVLSVSTIEVRKNHMYMVRVWEKLIENKVPNIPNLVFAGKIGWDIEQFQQYLNESDHLEGRLRLVHGVTDFELCELYKHAMFTIFPSFVEGFGLPVAESLAYGKPCISSNRASMPEVGGKFARYVDPENVNEGYALVRNLLTSPEKLERWTQEIASSHKPKTRREFTDEFFGAVTEISKPDDFPINGVIDAAEITGMGSEEITDRDELDKPLTYLAASREIGWHAVESWGCWTAARRATLVLRTRLPPNTPVTIYLSLVVPNGTVSGQVSVKIDAGGVIGTFKGLRTSPSWFILDGKTCAEGEISIVLISVGPFAKPDTREIFVGLTALGYCETADAISRIELIEKITLGRHSVGRARLRQRQRVKGE